MFIAAFICLWEVLSVQVQQCLLQSIAGKLLCIVCHTIMYYLYLNVKRLYQAYLISQDGMVHVPVHILRQCCLGIVTGKTCITVPTVWQIYRFTTLLEPTEVTDWLY